MITIGFVVLCLAAICWAHYIFSRVTGNDILTLYPPDQAKQYKINKILNRYQTFGEK